MEDGDEILPIHPKADELGMNAGIKIFRLFPNSQDNS